MRQLVIALNMILFLYLLLLIYAQCANSKPKGKYINRILNDDEVVGVNSSSLVVGVDMTDDSFYVLMPSDLVFDDIQTNFEVILSENDGKHLSFIIIMNIDRA